MHKVGEYATFKLAEQLRSLLSRSTLCECTFEVWPMGRGRNMFGEPRTVVCIKPAYPSSHLISQMNGFRECFDLLVERRPKRPGDDDDET